MRQGTGKRLHRQTTQTPLWRTAWRRIVHRPLQCLLLVTGVALGVAMMVSIDVANTSASRAFELSAGAVAGRATHQVIGGPSGLDESVYTRLRVSMGYSPAAPIVEGYVLGRDLGEYALRLVGVDIFAEPPFRDYFEDTESGLMEGMTPLLTQPDAIILSSEPARRHNVNLGDRTILHHGGKDFNVRVAGIISSPDDADQQGLADILFCDIATAQELLGMTGRLSHIDLIVPDKASFDAIEAILPPGVSLVTAAARSNVLAQMTAAFELNLTALSLLALMVGMFLIYNSVSFSVVQQRRFFGILRCLGVTRGQIFSLVLVEGAVIGLFGGLIGLGLGVMLGQAMVGLVTQTINDLYFVLNVRHVTVPPATLVKGLVAGIGVAVFASLLPAIEAMRTTPRDNLNRSSLEARSRRILPFVTLSGGVLVLAGWLLPGVWGSSLVLAFTGLFMLLFGMTLLTPAATVLAMRGLKLAGIGKGVLGRMASRNIVRSISRTAVAIAALMMAVSVIVGVSIMIGSFRGTVSHWLENTFQADIYVSPPALAGRQDKIPLDPEVVALVSDWPGARRVVSAHDVRVMAPQLGRQVELISVDGDVSEGSRRYLWHDGRKTDLWDRLETGDGIMISEPLFNREGMHMPPEPIRLMTDAGPRDFPVLAIYYDYGSDQGSIMMGQDLFRKAWEDDRVTSIALFLGGGENAEAAATALREELRGRQDVIIQSSRLLRARALDIFDRTFAITAALKLLAVAVAFIGILSSLMSLMLERGRELGMLRAMGMSPGQMWRVTFLEAGLMGAMAGLMAMPVGWALAWVLIYIINLRSFGWTMEMLFLPGTFLQAFLVALGAALLAGIYPALRLGRMDIAQSIREE